MITYFARRRFRIRVPLALWAVAAAIWVFILSAGASVVWWIGWLGGAW